MSDRDFMNGWTEKLARTIAATVREFQSNLYETKVVMLAIDCAPWNGILELALLTQQEADIDQLLTDPAEMAAWKNYAFSESLEAWKPAKELAKEMKETYAVAKDRKECGDAFFRACAAVMGSKEVDEAIELLPRDDRFRISVAHPDDSREFCKHVRGTEQ